MKAKLSPNRTKIFAFSKILQLLEYAEVVELVDTKDLKSFAFGRAGSIPALGTKKSQRKLAFKCGEGEKAPACFFVGN